MTRVDAEPVATGPEARASVAAVFSLAGAVGGSPLAKRAEPSTADLLQLFPGAECDGGDGGGAVDSLRPGVPRPRKLKTQRGARSAAAKAGRAGP